MVAAVLLSAGLEGGDKTRDTLWCGVRKETRTRGGPTWVHFNGGGVTTGKVQVCRDKRVARGKRVGARGDPCFNGNSEASGRNVLRMSLR